jgi:hypothetical protein
VFSRDTSRFQDKPRAALENKPRAQDGPGTCWHLKNRVKTKTVLKTVKKSQKRNNGGEM